MSSVGVGSAEYGSIGPYRIVRRLGFGRKSEVLLATRLFPGNFERRVVIKRLLGRCEDDPARQAVLAGEALAYSRVNHPAIVQLFDFFSHEGHLALVLEYVDGLSLSKLLEALRLRREPLSDGVALFIASRVFAALAAAHSAKDPRTGENTPVIHRDVNPSNILIPWDGFVKVGDFDLSKVIGVSGDTVSGVMKGTYGYMAPEQVTGDPVTPRTDVYAGCIVLRELLLGKPTFDEKLPELELLTSMLETRLPPIESLRSGIPRRLSDALARGLAKDPEERSLTAQEMVEILRSHADMEVSHAELIARLGRIRPMEERGILSQSAPTPPVGVASVGSGGSGASGSRSSRSRWSFATPRTMSVSHESMPPLEKGGSVPPPPGPRSERGVTLPAALTAVAVVALAFAVGTSLRAATSAALATAPATDSPPAVESPPAQVHVPTLGPAPAPTTQAATHANPVGAAPTTPAVASAPSPAPPSSAAAPASADNPADGTTGTIVAPMAARHHRIWVDGEVVVWSTGSSLRVPCGPHVVRIGSSGASQTVEVPCGGRVILEAGSSK